MNLGIKHESINKHIHIELKFLINIHIFKISIILSKYIN